MNDTPAFETHRPRLLAIAYRMLGSVADAEDMVQETWLRWREAKGVDHAGAFLRRVLINCCLDLLRVRQRERAHYIGYWLPEPWLDPAPPASRQTLSTAFLLLLEQLSPIERAAYVLREVGELGHGEIAAALDLSEANARQLYSRARRRLAEAQPPSSTLAEEQGLLARFLVALQGGDLAGLQACLCEDAILYADGGGKARSALRPIYGASKIQRLLFGLKRKQAGTPSIQLLSCNGGPAVLLTVAGGDVTLLSLGVRDGRVERVYMLRNPEKLARLTSLPAPPAAAAATVAAPAPAAG